ncbi:MAG: hypothetical protein CMB32_05200 [Euryarchaeota archaeon]|nr:hypothetical protein [Euryarchaeota archaeon]|tara:strand:+ start:1022 stop:1405 length:384 start_codon:yes stop_codon:yes gene_type:complete
MNRFFPVLTLSVIAIFASSCYEVEETIANITVVRIDAVGEEIPVDEAEVRLFALGSLDEDFVGEPRFDTTQVTSDEGFVSFNFSDWYVGGQAGFAVLDIEVTKGALTGSGLIKIEEMETNSETVIVQ